MKFCISCGKEIDDNANACQFCGAMQGAAPQGAGYGAPQGTGYGAPQGAPYGAPVQGYAPAQRGGLKISIGGIVAFVGYLLMMIAIFVPMYSAMGRGLSIRLIVTMATTMSIGSGEGAGVMMFLLFWLPLIMAILGMICAAVSVFTRNKVLLLVVTILEVIFAIIAIIVLVMAKSEAGPLASLSVGFFLYIIGIVVALVGMILDYAGKRK